MKVIAIVTEIVKVPWFASAETSLNQSLVAEEAEVIQQALTTVS